MVDKEQLTIKRETLLRKLELLKVYKKEHEKENDRLIRELVRDIQDLEEEIAK